MDYDRTHEAVKAWWGAHSADDCEPCESDELSYEFMADAAWAALEELLETSTNDDGELLRTDGYRVEDIDAESGAEFAGQVADFCHAMCRIIQDKELGAGTVGHNFTLTRNWEGTGFWDLGLGSAGEELTGHAHPYGECGLYVGDDGVLYVHS